jgi:predicted N-formylglutamate amidohydrolase
MTLPAESASDSELPLIGPADPPPFENVNAAGRAPLLLVCDHASRAFPQRLRQLGLAEESTRRHIAWDIGAGDLTRALAERFDAPALLAGYSRLVIDCNRALHDPTSIVAVSDGEPIPGNQGLSPAARHARTHAIFEPYHKAIAARLQQLRRAGITPTFLSIHSFTPVMDGAERPWHVGVLWDRDPRIAVPLLERLRARSELHVGDNLPYSGRHPSDYTVSRHAVSAGLRHVCIEVRQDLIDVPAGVARWAAILVECLQPILAKAAQQSP